MFNIATYLTKFKNIIPPNAFIKEECSKVVNDELGVELSGDEINVQRGVVYIKANQIIKSEILLNKNKILERLNLELEKYNRVVQDIR
ncbi:hypothetical protein IIB50_00950 [Patescibacteria group bacterium]|nr:hypothetical protein [Patescibacteria group bacterium]